MPPRLAQGRARKVRHPRHLAADLPRRCPSFSPDRGGTSGACCSDRLVRSRPCLLRRDPRSARRPGAPARAARAVPITSASGTGAAFRSRPLRWDRRGIEERIWSMLYHPSAARRVLHLVDAAAEGDVEPLVRQALTNSCARKRGRSEGLMLSVLHICRGCAAARARRRLARSTPDLFHAPVSLELVRACREWPVGVAPDGFATPLSSDKPILLLSGALDPVTPPELAAAAARHLPNTIHLINPQGGHAGADTCTREVVGRFISLAAGEALGRLHAAMVRVPATRTRGAEEFSSSTTSVQGRVTEER